MKKVLILAYDFPPFNSIGAQRPASWLKYFPSYGIDVTIVTRHWDNNVKSPIDYIRNSTETDIKTEIVSKYSRIIRAPFKPNFRDKYILKYGLQKHSIIRKILSFILSVFKFIFPSIDPGSYSIYKAASSYIKVNHVDLIIATAEPFVLFKYADMLSSTSGIPWVADYRDCWNEGPQDKPKDFLNRFLRSILVRIEKKLIQSALLITTPSPSYQIALKKLHSSKKIEVVYNGHDINETELIESSETRSKNFEIAYAGIIYPHQQLEVFLEGVKLFTEKNSNIEMKLWFYGLNFYPEMVKRLNSYDKSLLSIINTTDRIPYENVIKKMRQAQILLLLSDEGANWLNAKVFDYLAISKPILLVKNDKGILEKILDDSGIGYKASSEEDVKNILQNLYNDYFLNNIKFRKPLNSDFYSRKTQAGTFAELITNNLKES